MKVLLALLIGGILGFGLHWYVAEHQQKPVTVNAREVSPTFGDSVKKTFDTDAIKEELSRTGKVIREKARQAGQAISDSTANARTTATIKTKLLEEQSLSALGIDVDTTDGVVTLSGKVSSYEQIGQAMRLAMETDGVHQVISTLQLKAPVPEATPAVR